MAVPAASVLPVCWSSPVSSATRPRPTARTRLRSRDPAVVLEVLGQVDRGHAALAELPLDAVALGEGGLEAGHRVGHVWLGIGMLEDGGMGACCHPERS